jgi:hypothetical protein
MFVPYSLFVHAISETLLLHRRPDPLAPLPPSLLPVMKHQNAQYAKNPSLTNQSKKQTKKEAL